MNNTVGLALTEPKAPRAELKELGQEQLMPQAQRTLAQNVCNARSELFQMQGVLRYWW